MTRITITTHKGGYRKPNTYSIGANADEAKGDWSDSYFLPTGYSLDRNIILDPAGNACRLVSFGGGVTIESDDERYTTSPMRV